MTATGRYVLDLTCDAQVEASTCAKAATFEAKSASETRRQAREAGWTINDRECKTLCPRCRVILVAGSV
jgi:hypothetical protein